MKYSLHNHVTIVFIAVFAVLAPVESFNINDGNWTINFTDIELTNDTYLESTCAPDEFLCFNGNCVDQKNLCNGNNDCGDWSDEQFCNRTTCPFRQFNCTNGACVDTSLLCDNNNDCGDWSDELNFCDRNHLCRRGLFSCKDGSRCLSARSLCNGVKNCADGSDETYCTVITRSSCRPGMFLCKDGFCVSARSVCNGIRDCLDSSDELDCGNIRNRCQLGMFACKNNRCISAYYVCDGYNDCGDLSDEVNCRTTPTSPPACPPKKFTCWNGRCINFNWVCDGFDDCHDGSDEVRCKAHLSTGGVMGITVSCSVLITAVVIVVVCLRKLKNEKSPGIMWSSHALANGIPLQPLPQTTSNPQSAPTTSQQHGNMHSKFGRSVHNEPKTEVEQQQQSNLYPSLPQHRNP